MPAWNVVIVFGAAALGSLVLLATCKVQKRHSKEDAALQRELAPSGPVNGTGERTGVHVSDRVTVAELQAGIDETADPVLRWRSSSE